MISKNFSSQSDKYAQYRPNYPVAFFEYLNTILVAKTNAWDCGTGNGQVAYKLSESFEKVYASDSSQNQIAHAIAATNIVYSVQSAEKPSFPDNFFDLIIVAQAIHWFDFDVFYTQVQRTANHNAILVVMGYSLLEINQEIDVVIRYFYTNVIGNYWDKERKYIDENYQTIPFPFSEITPPSFQNSVEWTFEHLLGYLNTWSAVKHFQHRNNKNPVDEIIFDLQKCWGNAETRQVTFPLLLRIGKIRTQ